MRVSYKAKHRRKKILKIVGIIMALAVLGFVLRFIYLERFLVYDENGVHLDYGGRPVYGETEKNHAKDEDYIINETPALGEHTGPKISTLDGCFLTVSDVLDGKLASLSPAQEDVNAVMVTLKTDTGKYLYPTEIAGAVRANADLDGVEKALMNLSKVAGVQVIAKVPAFSDSGYAMADYNHALSLRNGALWMNENGSYCLDPYSKDTVEYLIATARELYSLGADEIVFDEFSFPKSENIVYKRDISGEEAVRNAAEEISERLSLWGIPVSFISDDPEVANLSHRMYLSGKTGADVADTAEEFAQFMEGETGKLVFLTASRDTRFEGYSRLQPIE
ncbi:MAG: hypothetical protein J6K84_00830 [Oscillospiraceae bacterium]|nr:hypothetical protein [Oscillospiraceae bacterium]